MKSARSVNVSSARYSNGLRWRIVYQGIAMNLPLVKIAQNVAVSTVHRIHVYRLKRVKLWTLYLHDVIYAMNCMLLELFWRTHQCNESYILETPILYRRQASKSPVDYLTPGPDKGLFTVHFYSTILGYTHATGVNWLNALTERIRCHSGYDPPVQSGRIFFVGPTFNLSLNSNAYAHA